ncbi:S-adenosyl-L-methionine-dependent methyltransferase [Mycena vulgaris]|nr:S-adenosyl-L-methionine-dependent methyltransferase [Mycena vulgaris]
MPRPASNDLQSAADASYDWYRSYADIAPLLRTLIPRKEARILILGCGNSTLSQDMYDDGYMNIVNIDYSLVVIEQMQARHGELRPKMQWLEMDVRDLKFADGEFDVAIDKGTMDAMMTAKSDPWNPPQQVRKDCNAEVNEVIRTLKKASLFICIAFGQPHFLRRYLVRRETTLKDRALGEHFNYYLYILRT